MSKHCSRFNRPNSAFLRRGLLVGSLLVPLAVGAAQAPTSAELMDWAQAKFPELFPGQLADVVGPGFVFRGPYATGNFLGVQNSIIYALGPPTGGQLLALGTLTDFACTVKPASCQPSDALALVNAHLAQIDAMNAAEITSATVRPFYDGCYLNSGRNLDAEMSRLDTDSLMRASANRKRGSNRRNAEILEERFGINPDGSDRREIDVRYELVYADGMVMPQNETFIQGSSFGTKTEIGSCATPQVSQLLRTLGNQRIVGTAVTSLSYVTDRYKLSDGTAQPSSPRQYVSQIRFDISDPANNATYATISGPGIVGSAYKMVAPRLLRTAPEFARRIGNYVDWRDDETFKACRISTSNGNYADAAVADCTANGAASNTWSASGGDPTAVDTTFAGYGFQTNGVYTIKVYNDDGWKTVNGQSGKTPIATYTTKLNRLPASAAALAAGTASAYGNGTLSMTPVQIAALIRSKAGGSLKADETLKAKVDTEALQFAALYFFEQGTTVASTQENSWPRSRYNPSMVTAIGSPTVTLDIPPGPAAITFPFYGEVGMIWDDLNGFQIRRLLAFE